MLLKIVIAVALMLGVLALVVATRPAEFKIERSTSIAAPPSVIYAQIADFHEWAAWSPWAKLDPQMKTSYSGQSGTPGASYMWQGNDKVGEGRMTVLSAQPPAQLGIKLEFLKPFSATNESNFTLVPQGASTLVSWSMSGQNNFMAKAFAMMMNMDKMLGGDFDRGLAQLKVIAEAEAKKAAAAPTPTPGAAAAAEPVAAAPAAPAAK